jgi:arsenate reductase
LEAFSAGIKKTHVHPLAIQVLKENDIDISNNRSKTIDEFKGKPFDYVITVCDHAKETCPFFPGKKIIHKGFTDPSDFEGTFDEKLHAFRNTRDEIKQWIKEIFCT